MKKVYLQPETKVEDLHIETTILASSVEIADKYYDEEDELEDL